jgi:membrane associated rhomboid family serine protease
MSYYRHGPYRPAGSALGFGVPRLTPFVKAIMITCGVVWLVHFVVWRAQPLLANDISRTLGVSADGVLRGMLWQPLTYMFLHDPQQPFHLVFNMLMLWMFGSELETYWGSRQFLRFYLVAGAGGGIAAVLLGLLVGGGAIPTIGASGALFGLFVAFGTIFADRTILFMLLFPMKARTMAWIIVGLNFFYLLSAAQDGISYIAHLGGALVGWLYLRRAWRVGEFYRDLRWRLRRRRFKVMPPRDDRWVN